MRLLAFLLFATAAAAEDGYTQLCRTNPAYSPDIMQAVVKEQLSRDHDPALDSMTPDQLAASATDQGVSECATDLQRDPVLYGTILGTPAESRNIAWDAYNTACADRRSGKGDCVKAEIGSQQALRLMLASDKPPGAKAIAQTCELVLQADPAMADWRECVDVALAEHATPQAADACKLSVTWHATKNGAEAGHLVASCLRQQAAIKR